QGKPLARRHLEGNIACGSDGCAVHTRILRAERSYLQHVHAPGMLRVQEAPRCNTPTLRNERRSACPYLLKSASPVASFLMIVMIMAMLVILIMVVMMGMIVRMPMRMMVSMTIVRMLVRQSRVRLEYQGFHRDRHRLRRHPDAAEVDVVEIPERHPVDHQDV